MVVTGFKAFDSKTNNRYGMHFEEKKVYSVDGNIKFGTCGNGYHMCTNLEDTLRYVDNYDDIVIGEVIGFGDIDQYDDEYNGAKKTLSAAAMTYVAAAATAVAQLLRLVLLANRRR